MQLATSSLVVTNTTFEAHTEARIDKQASYPLAFINLINSRSVFLKDCNFTNAFVKFAAVHVAKMEMVEALEW